MLCLACCADETERDPPEEKIGLHLIVCYFVNCLSAACLLLALQEEGASHLSSQFLCSCLSRGPSRSSGRIANLPPSHLRSVVTLPCLFGAVLAPRACAAAGHVSLRSRTFQRSPAEEGRSRWQPCSAPAPPGEEWRTLLHPGGQLPRGSGSHLSPLPLGVGAGGSPA